MNAENATNKSSSTSRLAFLQGYDLYKHFDRIMTKKWFWTVKAQPVVVKGVHFVKGPGSSVSDIVLPVIKKMVRYGREECTTFATQTV